MRTRLVRHLLTLLLMLTFSVGSRADAPKVVVIDIHGPLWPGTSAFVVKQLGEAWKSGASGVILDLDTISGTTSAAEEIKTAVLARSRDLPIAAYVHDRALGPGSLVAVACKTLALSPGASLGGATGSSLKNDLRGAADATGRNPAIAAAFVSADAPLPALGVNFNGSLTLTANQAKTVGYADVIAADLPDVLTKMGFPGARVVPVHLDPWFAAALWVSQPWATILLLVIGLVLVIAELLTLHSWGIAGVIGAATLLGIFAAHIAVGTAGWVGLVLILAGLALLLFETHVFPGHGLSALAGLTLLCVGVYFALGGAETGAIYSLAAALLVTVATLIAFFAYLPRSRVWNVLAQPMRQSAASGYVPSDDYTPLLGEVGIAVTLLRPSGTVEVAGLRLPVVTEGEFIAAGSPVQVVLVQGNKIVVRMTG